MGCDIHPFIERRTSDGRWEIVTSSASLRLGDRQAPLAGLSHRNYALFGVLAGVRTRDTSGLFTGRGLPGDVSPETATEYALDDGDAHSVTWFTVDELVKIDWDAPRYTTDLFLSAHAFLEWIKSDGVVRSSELLDSQIYLPALHRADGKAANDCRIVTPEEMTLLLVANRPEDVSPVDRSRSKKPPGVRSKKLDVRRCGAFAQVKGQVTYRAVVSDFVENMIPALIALGEPDRTRVVIWFDN